MLIDNVWRGVYQFWTFGCCVMEKRLFNKIISKLLTSNKAGFGYIEDFIEILSENRTELNINNAVVVWQYRTNEIEREDVYFLNNQKFSFDCFNFQRIWKNNCCLDSRRDNLKSFKNSNQFDGFHSILIPICLYSSRDNIIPVRGMLLLLSMNGMEITFDELDILYNIIKRLSPKTLDCPNVIESLNILMYNDVNVDNISLEHRHTTLLDALDVLSNKRNEDLKVHGLRHFSFWSYDNMPTRYLHKEFNKNTYNNKIHGITHCVLRERNHYMMDYLHKYCDKLINLSFEEQIEFYDFSAIKDSFIDKDYFDELDLNDNNFIVVIVPIKFELYTTFCCFYIKDIIYTPFISLSVFKELADAIRQRINLVNEVNIKNMLSKMLEKSTDSSNINYYRNVADILKKGNEATDCLLYLKGVQSDRFFLVTEEEESKTSSIKQPNVEIDDFVFYLPMQYLVEKDFVKHVKSALEKQGDFTYCTTKSVNIKSASMVQIIEEEKTIGFVLLFNREHVKTKIKGIYFNNVFFYNNIYITNSCCNYLIHYRNLQASIYRKNYLLHKLRHEIPGCVVAIETAMKDMMAKIDDIGFRRTKFKMAAYELLMNNNRINLLASFFSAVDFDDNRFLENPQPFNLQDFVNTNLSIYNREAVYKGVQVKCNIGIDTPTLEVSGFFQLALSNLIINAIRYASVGSIVWIRSNSDEITVSDIGLGIKDNEKDLIFTEGYRGKKARSIEQKGMGYGLYLTKRILDAYSYPIEVNSVKVSDINWFAQNMVYKGYRMLSQDARKEFLMKDIIDGEEIRVISLLHTISKSANKIEHPFREFLNEDSETIKTWLDYYTTYGTCFLDMDEELFQKAIHRVSFKINIYP